MKDNWVVVFDVDGVFTPGNFYYTEHGKIAKEFGADDFDAVRELMRHAEVCIITADKKGYPIVKKRFEEEMGWKLHLIVNKPPSYRWLWIREQYPNSKICYVGDGLYDWYCLEQADFGIAPPDALPHVKLRANHVTVRTGGRRFVAEACLYILSHFFDVNTACIGEPS
jgi:YrbI family 3-deoxy-D-manno-octulosonate 8-phosphate phosphatase